MSNAELVHAPDVPLRSAIKATALLHDALQTSLEEYITAHFARRRPTVADSLDADGVTEQGRSAGPVGSSEPGWPSMSLGGASK